MAKKKSRAQRKEERARQQLKQPCEKPQQDDSAQNARRRREYNELRSKQYRLWGWIAVPGFSVLLIPELFHLMFLFAQKKGGFYWEHLPDIGSGFVALAWICLLTAAAIYIWNCHLITRHFICIMFFVMLLFDLLPFTASGLRWVKDSTCGTQTITAHWYAPGEKLVIFDSGEPVTLHLSRQQQAYLKQNYSGQDRTRAMQIPQYGSVYRCRQTLTTEYYPRAGLVTGLQLENPGKLSPFDTAEKSSGAK